MKWDMEDMGAVMFLPVVFCLHIVLICLGFFTGELLQGVDLLQGLVLGCSARVEFAASSVCLGSSTNSCSSGSGSDCVSTPPGMVASRAAQQC
jgi:hypothetical protein